MDVEASTRPARQHGRGRVVLSWLVAVGLLVAPFLVSPFLFGQSYPRWFLLNGALLALISAAIAPLLPADGLPLVSVNPVVFFRAHRFVFRANSAPIFAAVFRVQALNKREAGPFKDESRTSTRASVGMSAVLAAMLTLLSMFAAAAWAVLALPGLYFVRLFTGSLPRLLAFADTVVVARNSPTGITFTAESRRELRPGQKRFDPAASPVAYADSLGALILFMLAQLPMLQ